MGGYGLLYTCVSRNETEQKYGRMLGIRSAPCKKRKERRCKQHKEKPTETSAFKVKLEVVETKVIAGFNWCFAGRSATSQAKEGRPDAHEAEFAPDEAHDIRVSLTRLVGEFLC